MQLGHKAYEPGTIAFSKVVEEFGECILGADGKIDRKILGPMVFKDKVWSCESRERSSREGREWWRGKEGVVEREGMRERGREWWERDEG